MRVLITSFALATVLGSASAASAQMASPSEPAPATSLETTVPSGGASTGPTVWGILPSWHGGWGIGGRFMLPLGIKPLLNHATIKDSFALEFGADFMHWSYAFGAYGDYSWNQVLPVVGGMWNLAINEQLTVYPKLDLGYAFGWFSGWNDTWVGSQPSYGGFFWNIALGAMYKLNNGIALRGEVGYAGLKVGAAWLF